MTDSDPYDEIVRDDELLSALSGSGVPSTSADETGALLGELARVTDLDYTDEAAVQAALVAAGAGGTAAATAGHSWLRQLFAWTQHHRFLVLWLIAGAGVAAGVVAALQPGSSGPSALPVPAQTTTSTGMPSAAGSAATSPAAPGTASRSAAPTPPPVASGAAVLPLLPGTSRATVPGSPVPTPPPAPAPSPVPSSTAAPSTPPATPTASPTSSPSSTTSPTSPPPCRSRTARLDGATATFARSDATHASLTWRDPFGAGKDLVLTYTARPASGASRISSSGNFQFTSGPASGGLQLDLDAGSPGGVNGIDVDVTFTYGGRPISVRDATFLVTDIDGPYIRFGNFELGAEQVSLTGPGSGSVVDPAYLTGNGSATSPWQRANPSTPDLGDLLNTSTDGDVRIQQPQVTTSTIHFTAGYSWLRSNNLVWLTPPSFAVTEPGC